MSIRLPALPAAAGTLLLVGALLGGCATPQVAALREQSPAGLPARHELDAVPFFPQEDYQCGPAALATALTDAGAATSPEALTPQVFLPARAGSLQAEMLAAARRQEFVAYTLAPRLEDLLREVAAGNPVIVLQNLGLDFFPLWHYAVVVGYDLPGDEILLRSGTTRRLSMALDTFDRTWARSGRWAMLTLPPDRLPASAAEERYVASVAALERVAPGAARRAYGTALERWPASLPARMGEGNAAYALRDLAAAEAAYREATRRHPGAADAWNNLAQALLELNRRDEALAAAQRAVELGGLRLGTYRETLRTVDESR